MKNIQKISQYIKTLNDKLEGISDELLSAINKYQRAYERELYNIDFDIKDGNFRSTIKNYNRAIEINPIKEQGFNAVAKNHINNYDKVPELQQGFNKKIGLVSNYNYRNIKILGIAKRMDFANLYNESEALDLLIKKQLVNAIALNAPLKSTISNLADDLLGSGEKLGKLSRYSTTYMRTSLFALSRTIDHEAYKELKPEKYIYIGVISDKRIRPFCRSHVGNTYTVEEIEKFPIENESGLNPFASPGGFNCRHRLIPVIEN